ncbi:MAG: 16S rRNA (cytosine(1402)-N(4))-methyltransferase RsmH [Candidatus Promineifilaceae bacterium]
MHVTVLYKEVLHWLQPKSGGLYIDGTLGYGGHTSGILTASAPDGRILAFDRDADAIQAAQARLGGLPDEEISFGTSNEQRSFKGDLLARVTFAHTSFAEMRRVAPSEGFPLVDGVVLDLGLSSMQLDSRNRGFAFRYDAPLDMRFDQRQSLTAATLINNTTENELLEIFESYGEVRRGRRMVRVVMENRPILTTKQLADLIARATPAKERRKRKTHPATQVFQALRIAVNDELDALAQGLSAALNLLKPGGRVAVISFHSLEDRYVKRLFRELATECICPPRQPICTCDHKATIRLPHRKAIQPSTEELEFNPRSRSAKLRIAEKI